MKGIQFNNQTDLDASKAEKIITNDERVTNAVSIFFEREIVLGVTVKTFSRFHKKKIEKELKKKLEKEYSGYNILVSADQKVVLEASKLLKVKDQEELDKKLKKLLSLTKEET